VRARHGPPVRTMRSSRSRARFRVPCGAASAHHARNLAPDGGPGTVRASRAGARSRVPCSAASAHHARNLAPDGGRGTVRGRRRTGGAVRARHGPPVRTVQASRSGARFRVPCGAASAHHARNPAPGGGLSTVRASRAGARFRVPCGATSAHHARNLAPGGGPGTVRGRRRTGGAARARHGPPVRTVRPSRSGARFRVPCGAASAHQARDLARDGGRGTVRGCRRPGGAVRARHGPPVRTVRASRSRARFRVPCSAASSAPRAQPRTRRRRPRTVRGPGTVPARPRQPAGVAVAVADADGCSAARTASTTGCAPPGSVNSVDCAVIQYGSAKASARPTSPLRAK